MDLRQKGGRQEMDSSLQEMDRMGTGYEHEDDRSQIWGGQEVHRIVD